MSFVALLRDASHAGTMMIALKKIGPKKVAMRNHFDRTRSRYSRLMTAQSLAMSTHPLLDACGPGACTRRADASSNFLRKDLMQRRLDHLESLYRRAGGDDALEQCLWIRPRCQLDLEEAVGIVGALNE